MELRERWEATRIIHELTRL